MLKLEKDRKEYADLTWILLIFLSWLIGNYVDLIGNDKLAERLYFLLNSFIVLLVAYAYLKDNWLKWAIVEIAVYWLFDEVRSEGDIYHWYEFPLIIFILLTNYTYYKYKK